MCNLSIFVDESGDFGKYAAHSPYYIVTMVFHEQSNDISQDILRLNAEIQLLGYTSDFVIHTAPLIRKEERFSNVPPNERRALFSKLFFFVIKTGIRYKTFIFEKKQFMDTFKLEGRMARDISVFFRNNLDYFTRFDEVILYYDNGQHELNRILNTVLSTELSHYDFHRALPKNYKLFQAADLICTLTLLSLKCEQAELTHSEQLIFHSKRELRKHFIKPLMDRAFK